MNTRLLLVLVWLAGSAAPARAGFNFSWSGGGTVASGASYSVSVSAFFAGSPGDPYALLGLYMDGLQVGAASISPYSWGGSGGTFAQPGPQSVSFSADAFSYFGDSGYSSGPTVTIAAPPPPVETWTPFDEPRAWVFGAWAPTPSTVWEDQTFTQTRTNTRIHDTGERSNLGNTRNLGSYTESATETTPNVPGTRPLNPRIVSSSDAWGAWTGSAPAETPDNPPWSWSSWSPAPGWYWEDQPATTTAQTRTGTRTVTYTTAAYTQTRTGTHTDNWTNDRGNTWSTTSALSDSQTIPASSRTEAQTTSDSQTVADTSRPLNPRHVLATGAWQDFSAWTPDTDTVPAGQAFTQTQTFRRWLTDYWTNDRGDVSNDASSWENSSASRAATGTGAVPNSAPTASLTGPTTLPALQSGTWNFSAADVDGNLSQWRFYNSTNPGAGYSPITTGSSVSGSHTQSFATAGQQIWNLDIVDTAGATAARQLTVTVTPAPQGAVTLTPASASVTAGGAATFTASGGTGTGAYTWSGTAGATGTGTSKTITFPTAGTFTVTAFRAADATYAASTTASASVTVTAAADTLAPSAPTGLATTFVAAASFTLSWTASTDNVGVAGYDVRLDGGAPVAADGAGGLSHTFTGLAFNSTHVAEVRARDAAGNVSAWSAHTAATNGGSTGLNNGQSAWLDVDGDGIRDEIVPADSADFTYDILQWFSVESLPATFQPNDFWFHFDTVFIDADGGRLFDGFAQIFVPTPVTLTETWFELVLNFRTLAGRPYSIYTDSVSVPDANGVFVINPAVWTRLLHQAIPPAADSATNYSTTFLVADEFVGTQFFYVRHGLPLNLVRVSIPGVGDLDVGSGGINGTLRLPNGASISVGPAGGSLTLPGGGASISVSAAGIVNVSGVGPLVAGQSVTIGSATVAVDAGGNVVITDGGTQVTLNAGGGGSILCPGGIGIAVDASGRIGLAAGGASPIIARVLDTANRVLNGDQLGAAIVLADILGVETRIPTLIGDIDIAALTQGGLLGLGIERGNTVFVLTKPKLPEIKLAVDANRDGAITFDAADATSESNPYRFWLNDDDDDSASHGASSPADASNPVVDGVNDLADFFPVFLDIKNTLRAYPPGIYSYKLRQADGAVNFAYSNSTLATAFAYRTGNLTTGFGDTFTDAPSSAAVHQIIAAGHTLLNTFLVGVRDHDQGVLLIEARSATTAPLVLEVFRGNTVVTQAILPLAINPRVLLLLHGMNSNTDTWNALVGANFGDPLTNGVGATEIRVDDGSINGSAPLLTTNGVRCYRLQFGGFETAQTTRIGLEDVSTTSDTNYLGQRKNRSGDFET